jgi:transcriptional regulator with XRE-family HTH domain
MSNVADALRAARVAKKGTPEGNQGAIAKKLGMTPGNLSRAERGLKQPGLDVVERWADAVGMRLAVVPAERVDAAELTQLDPALLDILLRLARVLPKVPPPLLRDLQGRVESWTEDYLAAEPMTQDSRASVR